MSLYICFLSVKNTKFLSSSLQIPVHVPREFNDTSWTVQSGPSNSLRSRCESHLRLSRSNHVQAALASAQRIVNGPPRALQDCIPATAGLFRNFEEPSVFREFNSSTETTRLCAQLLLPGGLRRVPSAGSCDARRGY